MRTRLTTITLTILALALSACSGGAEPEATPEEAASTPATEPSMEPTETETEVLPEPETPFAVLSTTGDELPAGTLVETGTEPAAITFADGSVLRLDAGASFTVGDQGNRGTLHGGLSWTRVAPQSTGDFRLTLGTTEISALGTAFAADCTLGSCQLVVLEGEVDVGRAQVTAGHGIELAGDSPMRPFLYDEVFGNEFVKVAADTDATEIEGASDAATLAAAIGIRFASWQGTFSGERVVTACDGVCSSPVGDRAPRTYVFGVDCSAGFPCQGVGTTEYSEAGEVRTAELPMGSDGDKMTYTFHTFIAPCSDGSGQYSTDFSWIWTAEEAAIVDGAYVVTRATGTAHVVNDPVDPGTCDPPLSTNSGAVDVTRQ